MNAQGKTILETKRLILREMTPDDLPALCLMLQDEEVMYAYVHAFSDAEARDWLERQLARYRQYGFGLWAMTLRDDGELIGQCGLTMQDIEGEQHLEIGYLLRKEYWHRGYATEAARACKRYAFDVLGAGEVCSIIRDSNLASQRVALRNGMQPTRAFVKHYYGIDMPHLVFTVQSDRPAARG